MRLFQFSVTFSGPFRLSATSIPGPHIWVKFPICLIFSDVHSYRRTLKFRDMNISRIWAIGNSRAWNLREFLGSWGPQLSNSGFGLKIGPLLSEWDHFSCWVSALFQECIGMLVLVGKLLICRIFACMKSSRFRKILEHFMHANISCSTVICVTGRQWHFMQTTCQVKLF